MIWFIKKVNRIPTHCDVAYESIVVWHMRVSLLAIGRMIRVWMLICQNKSVNMVIIFASYYVDNHCNTCLVVVLSHAYLKLAFRLSQNLMKT